MSMEAQVQPKNVNWFCEPLERQKLVGPITKGKTYHCHRTQVLFPIVLVSFFTRAFHLLPQSLGVQVTFV